MKLRVLFLILISGVLNAQVLQWVPQFPTADSSITITYDVTKGNAALVNVFPVYFHTGVITNLSTSPGDWRYVVTTWGKADPAYQMTYLGNNKWQLHFDNIRKYYGVPQSEKILKLAFVFRNGDDSKVGRNADSSDIFLPLSQGGLNVRIVQPTKDFLFTDIGANVNVVVVANNAKTLSLYLNNIPVKQTNLKDTLNYTVNVAGSGKYRLKAVAANDSVVKYDSTYFVVRGNVEIANLPTGIVDGINYINDSTVTLSLEAPGKKFVYVIGDFNNWEVDPNYYTKNTPDGKHWWITIHGLIPKKEYAFQYFVDGKIRIADPYTEKILDPWNDIYIDSLTYPHLKPYPAGKTSDAVSVLQTAQVPYKWKDVNFKKPAKFNLVIYELLVRDFVKTHNYQTLTDTLDYLKKLGINAIELMPIMEFEGNISWGYNTDFWFAPDKYYGTKQALKKFIDACHQKGIAVILDIVLDHAFGQSPFVRLYALGHYGPPSKNNPWLNPDMNPSESGYQAPHPYGVGYDFNFESPYTKEFVNRVNRFWVKEYHVDGYRYDLSKGFTQTYSDNDVGQWGQYDASRIKNIELMADSLWTFDSTTYMILEHFAVNTEEIVLSKYNLMLWGNMSGHYQQASMGYPSGPPGTWDLTGTSYQARKWTSPNLVAYMESHDEQRMMYKNLQWGNSNGSYKIKNLATALNRIKLCEAFFYTIPGPKMLWQFGELGYDYPINYPSNTDADRTAPKPIRWDYYKNPDRLKLYKTTAALIKLKENYPVFRSSNFSTDLSGAVKRITIFDSTMNVDIIGNFDVVNRSINPDFPNAGKWYDYFSGDSMTVSNTTQTIGLLPGEFHIYTTVKLPTPEKGIVTAVQTKKPPVVYKYSLEQNYPNPFNPATVISYQLSAYSFVKLNVYDILGRRVKTLINKYQKAGDYKINFNASGLASGIYFYKLTAGPFSQTKKMILLR